MSIVLIIFKFTIIFKSIYYLIYFLFDFLVGIKDECALPTDGLDYSADAEASSSTTDFETPSDLEERLRDLYNKTLK